MGCLGYFSLLVLISNKGEKEARPLSAAAMAACAKQSSHFFLGLCRSFKFRLGWSFVLFLGSGCDTQQRR